MQLVNLDTVLDADAEMIKGIELKQDGSVHSDVDTIPSTPQEPQRIVSAELSVTPENVLVEHPGIDILTKSNSMPLYLNNHMPFAFNHNIIDEFCLTNFNG